MDIKEIKEGIKDGEYEISYHAEKERYTEDISISDIEAAIFNGEILEDYPDDQRGPSCLVLGYSIRIARFTLYAVIPQLNRLE